MKSKIIYEIPQNVFGWTHMWKVAYNSITNLFQIISHDVDPDFRSVYFQVLGSTVPACNCQNYEYKAKQIIKQKSNQESNTLESATIDMPTVPTSCNCSRNTRGPANTKRHKRTLYPSSTIIVHVTFISCIISLYNGILSCRRVFFKSCHNTPGMAM